MVVNVTKITQKMKKELVGYRRKILQNEKKNLL